MHAKPKIAVVGSGPNGLTAAAILARSGCEVQVYEAAAEPGGAARSEIGAFGPGTIVDLGAAGHPFGISSPAFRDLELGNYGLQWLHPEFPLAHPLVDAEPGLLFPDVNQTADNFDPATSDGKHWRLLHEDACEHIDQHLANFLQPMVAVPQHPLRLLKFGIPALASAQFLARRTLLTPQARALLAGSAVHAVCPPSTPMTGSFGILFGALGMTRGWPVAAGGTQAIVNALLAVLKEHGGAVHTDLPISDLRQLGACDGIVLNLTARQALNIAGVDFGRGVKRALKKWRYGTAVHKVDYMLSTPISWNDERIAQAGTVHVCGTMEEIDQAERQAQAGIMPERPFVMLCQQQVADPSRGTAGHHVVWSYAHVPHGYVERYPGEVVGKLEDQIERFAPGFRTTVLKRREMSPRTLELANPNLVGGDVAAGAMRGHQVLFRPRFAVDPYSVGAVSGAPVVMASGSTAPGAGVHGMPGYNAALRLLKHFNNCW